jgi:hypothetical protein
LAKLSFYERVVVAKCEDDPSLVGKAGHVLGVGEEGGPPVAYGVLLENASQVACFTEDELRGTGEIADRALFYDAPALRIRVIDGKGVIVDQ